MHQQMGSVVLLGCTTLPYLFKGENMNEQISEIQITTPPENELPKSPIEQLQYEVTQLENRLIEIEAYLTIHNTVHETGK